jgi:hypothetical protein
MRSVTISAANERRLAPVATLKGPVAAANRWFELIRRHGDFAAAWPLTDPELRRSAVAGWIDANWSLPALEGQDGAALIDALNVDRPTHRLWPHFAQTQLREFASTWRNIDLDRWNWANKPRPYSPDYEIAVLFDADGQAVGEAGLLAGLQLILHHVAGKGWLVAGFAGPIASVPTVT